MQATWLKTLIKWSLLVSSTFVISSSSESEAGSKWFEDDFNRFQAKAHETTTKFDETNSFVSADPKLSGPRLESKVSKRGFHPSDIKQNSKLRENGLFNRLQYKEHGMQDQSRSQPPEIRGIFSSEMRKSTAGKTDGKNLAILRSGDIMFNRWLSNADIREGKHTRNEASNYVNERRRYGIVISRHRISKRNANTSEPTQPSVVPTTEPTPAPPLLPPPILPPPPLLPDPRFNLPPACIGQRSCSGRCVSNATEWRTDESYTCFCDSACYEVFNDCCTDYTKYCGEQKRTEIEVKKFNWTCEPLGHFSSTEPHCLIGNGLWMVSRCPRDWPDDETRSKCENPTTRLRSASDINRYVPAVDGNITFRNVFCARCNGINGNVDFFPVEIKANVLPPEHYNFTEKVNFLLLNGAEFPPNRPLRPKSAHPRRYCLTSTIVDSCPVNVTSPACTKGPVALVPSLFSGKTFKNYECGLCNDPQGLYVCFPSLLLFACASTTPQRFVLRLDYINTSNEEASGMFTILKSSCRNGLTYDNGLQECVENFTLPAGAEDKIHILAWFAPSKDSLFTDKEFKTIMKRYFGVEESQIFNISIETVPLFLPTPELSILYHLVRSTLLLTPEQSLEILTDSNFSSTSLKLRNFVHFVKPLSINLNNVTYTIIKTTSRPLSCVTRKLYTRNDYIVLNDERVYITSTNIAYKRSEYFGEINGNITICERYVASNCKKAFAGLTREDFVIHKNLSLSRKDTGMLYEFGQYDVFNNSIALCDLENSLTCVSEKSCAGRCSNHTEWRTELKMRCSCDPDCYEAFNDCCSDYTKYCGAQTPAVTPTKRHNYTCEDVGHYDSYRCTIGDGLWMVSRCPPEWPDDDSEASANSHWTNSRCLPQTSTAIFRYSVRIIRLFATCIAQYATAWGNTNLGLLMFKLWSSPRKITILRRKFVFCWLMEGNSRRGVDPGGLGLTKLDDIA